MSHGSNRYDYASYEDEYRGFEIRDDESARGPLILALAIGVLIVFAAVVWNTYRQGLREEDGELPMVMADAEPFKSVPEDRGGIQIEDLDRRLYDNMDGSTRPPEPQPVAGERELAMLAGPPMDLRGGSSASSSQGAAPAEVQADDLPPLEQQVPAASEERHEEPSIDPAPPVEPARSNGRFAFTADGPFLVQISAVRTQAAADEAWSRVLSRYPDVFTGAQKVVERADLGADGIFFRVRAGRFDTRSDASEFCESYKRAGGDCIITRETP
jgi:hypothetical protein